MGESSDISRESTVTLREITEKTLGDFLKMKVAGTQERFVASNAVSIAQAHFSRNAWFRGIYAGDAPVGFIMLWDEPEKPEYFLWRLMIGAPYQKRGFGRRAVGLLIEHVKTRPAARELLVSCVEGEGSPLGFYEALGFRSTGDYEGEELILKLDLGDP